MKKKILVFTLCFTLIFTSLNYKKSYADVGLISLPLLATVSSIAVASGIVINNNDDLYDLGRMFYNYINSKNDITWDTLNATFFASVGALNNGMISVDSKFLDIVSDFFDNCFSDTSLKYNSYGLPTNIAYAPYTSINNVFNPNNSEGEHHLYDIPVGNGFIRMKYYVGSKGQYGLRFYYVDSYGNEDLKSNSPTFGSEKLSSISCYKLICIGNIVAVYLYDNEYKQLKSYSYDYAHHFFDYVADFPYEGGFDWDNVDSKKEEDGSIALPIPGYLGQLVGNNKDTFWDNTDNLVGDKPLSIPDVNNPSIPLDDVISFPNDKPSDIPTDTPTDTPFTNITDYIIGLVVPSDSYWTDTFGGLYNNFTSSFPMVDMDNFNNLVTGEKKFPNIDINIMGVKGRVVNGDVVNSIVDWLRPIIAGFMMLCLMLFNYRKIYKTIRGIEPFQGIAQGTSDFRTGISEYNYIGTGLSKSDYEANQMELAKALYDYEQDTGKTYKIKI